jgi:hypothetical protein
LRLKRDGYVLREEDNGNSEVDRRSATSQSMAVHLAKTEKA